MVKITKKYNLITNDSKFGNKGQIWYYLLSLTINFYDANRDLKIIQKRQVFGYK